MKIKLLSKNKNCLSLLIKPSKTIRLLLMVFVVFGWNVALAQTAGPNNAGTGTNIDVLGVNWLNPTRIQADDTNYATVTLTPSQSSDYISGANYGFAIPLTATIDGILVSIMRRSDANGGTNSIRDVNVYLRKAGVNVGINYAIAADWPTSRGAADYGGPTNLWGTTWTPAEINSTNFGVVLSVMTEATMSNRIASVDYIKITVYYKLAPTITSFTASPSCSNSGASVVINGTNFTGATAVKFNGVTASYTLNDSTKITAQLPATATTGAITVTTPGGTATSTGDFTVNAPAGDQTSYGTNSWIGYVYANTNGGNPPSNAFTTNYVGYISQPESFDLNLGTASISGTNLCNSYADNFAIRFKMNKNLTAGYYTFNVGGDDGYRLSLNGGAYVIDNWNAHSYQSTVANTVYLSGSTDFVLEYFENGIDSRVQFSYTFCASSTAPTSITGLNSLCLGDTTTLTASGGVLAINSVYQWGTGATVGSNIIAGQTAASLVVNPITTTTYWVRILDCTLSRPTIGVTTVITVSPVIGGNTISANQTICSGSTPAALTGSTPTGGNGIYVYNWESSTTSATTGFIPAAGTNNTTNYNPGSLSATTWYRRTVTSGGCANTATAIQISVSSIVVNNTISYTGALTFNAEASEGSGSYAVMTAPVGNVFTNVIFASYGTPNGTSPNYTLGTCHETTSQAKVETVLLGVNSFSIPATNLFFGDPCVNTLKKLYVLASYAVPICAGSTPSALTGSTPTGGNGTYGYVWESSTANATSGFGPAAGTNNTKDYSPSSLTQTTWFRRKVTSSCIGSITSSVVMITVSALPTAPKVGPITDYKCDVLTGSVVLTGLPSGNYTINPGNIPGSTATITINGLVASNTYNFTVTNSSGCVSPPSADVVIKPVLTNRWNGTAWSILPTPTIDQNIVFEGNYTSSVNLVGNILEGCTCTVNKDVKVIFKPNLIEPNPTLKITNGVFVDSGQNASLTFENNASLVQVNDNDTNTGDIIYMRSANTVNRSDYTYWSSPVKDQLLKDVSSSYTSGKFYSFNTTNWVSEATSNVMGIGNGYIIRGPQSTSPPASYDASFIGVPNNGSLSTPIGPNKTFNLIGNPYPCALDADAFLDDINNKNVLAGTIYFWTHNTAIRLKTGAANEGSGDYVYISDDYASYNGVGGLATSPSLSSKTGGLNTTVPSGKIAAGQAFFTTSIATGSNAVFNNSMRVDNSGNTLDNSQFFKISGNKAKTIEKNRIWLNLTNSQGAFKQTLVGYVTGATNGYDDRFDGESFNGNQFVNFYSINQNKNLAIQGRALPFDVTDEVPLGFSTTIDGVFTIKIDQADGLLAGQVVFIEDKLNNTVFDLKSGDYTFSTVKGTFNDRFVLRYTNKTLGTLGSQDFATQQNQVLVSNKNKQIRVHSPMETIDKVLVYDIAGKQIYQKTNVDSNELAITDLVSSHQVLVVKTVLQNGQTVTKKIIF